jgi:hypothetical protein
MYRVKLRLRDGSRIETGPKPGDTPKLGAPIVISYQGVLHRARVTNVVHTKPHGPTSEAVHVIDAEEI